VKKIFILIAALILCAVSPIEAEKERVFSGISELSTEEAIDYLKEIKDRYADDPEISSRAHVLLGIQYEKSGKDGQAIAEYLKVITNFPGQKPSVDAAEEKLKYLHKKLADPAAAENEQFESRTIFLSFVKSLYETYRNGRQFEKAINILKRLTTLESENPLYYKELGVIYLRGLNNPAVAIKYFNQALRLNPVQPNIYNLLGESYETMGDYNTARYYYNESIGMSPALSTTEFAKNRLRALDLTTNRELFKNWNFLGPVKPEREEEITERLLSGAISLDGSYESGYGKEISWRRPYSEDSFGKVNLKNIFDKEGFFSVFTAAYLYSPEPKNIQIRTGSKGPLTIYLNKDKILENRVSRRLEIDSDITATRVRKGWNEIILKLSSDWDDFAFFFRITDDRSEPLKKVLFNPEKNPNKVKVVYREIAVKEALALARNILIYGATIFFFVTGLFFMVSNIRSRIRINHMKSNFVANVSHQLKTPLTSIKMFAETLKMGKIDNAEKMNQYYNLIIKETDRLGHFVNNILNFSKLEKREKVYDFRKLPLNDIIKEALDVFEKEFISKDAEIKVELPENSPVIAADKQTLIEAVENLLNNAAKYSPKDKKIKVTVRDEPSEAVIEIEDTGMGIPKGEIGKIFEKFHRVQSKELADVKGTGLGLSFVKHIVEAHSGRITVRSKPGEGSIFVISLPKA
jgi:signal transduction histidine kinase